MHERPTNARSKQPALLDMHCCADRLLLCWHTRTHLNFVTFNRYETHTHKSAGEIACYICQVYIIIHDTYTGYVYITYIKKKKKMYKKETHALALPIDRRRKREALTVASAS